MAHRKFRSVIAGVKAQSSFLKLIKLTWRSLVVEAKASPVNLHAGKVRAQVRDAVRAARTVYFIHEPTYIPAERGAATRKLSLVVSTPSVLEDLQISNEDHEAVSTLHHEDQDLYRLPPGMSREEYELDLVYILSKYSYKVEA